MRDPVNALVPPSSVRASSGSRPNAADEGTRAGRGTDRAGEVPSRGDEGPVENVRRFEGRVRPLGVLGPFRRVVHFEVHDSVAGRLREVDVVDEGSVARAIAASGSA